jgi:D-3-phosphoglycerate dehydrogenase
VSSFKVALIDKEREDIPDFVFDELAEAGIEFVYGFCEDREDLERMASNADVVWIYGGCQLASRENMPLLTQCRGVIRSGSGVDRIDVEAATEHGIVVVNTPHAHHDAVSDHTIALMFAVGRRIASQDRAMRTVGWDGRSSRLPTWSLRNKTIGLLGFGLIPRQVASKLQGFDPTILVYDPYVDSASLAEAGVQGCELDDLLCRSDIVSVHTPLTAATRHMIGARELSLMKPDAILINTARGPVIEQDALVNALTEGEILGAGLDVFEVEPTSADNPLLALENLVATPHTAGFSAESVELTWRLSVEACIDLAADKWPRSYVNRSVTPRWALGEKERDAM